VIGLVSAVLWVVGNLWLPLYATELLCRFQPNCGVAGIGASSVGSGSTLLVLLVGSTIGSYWTIRRSRRRSAVSS
jgi:hypothetical protein